MKVKPFEIILPVLVGALFLLASDASAQIYNPYYGNPYAYNYARGYGGGYGGVQYYNYNAPYSHIYYSPTYSVQPRGYYSTPYYYGGYSGYSYSGQRPSKPSGGHFRPSNTRNQSSVRGEVPAGTVGWIPAPVSARSQKVQSGR